jgi:transposase
MVTIGIDPHKDTHQAVAVDDVGRQLAQRQVSAELEGFGQLLGWARQLPGQERVWVLEDCRHVSGALERFLLDHGEPVARLAPHMMAETRKHVRERGKSDPIDALAVARGALAEGVENLPTARLAGRELQIRLLRSHHRRLVKIRTALINDLRWNLHDLWPELKIGPRRLTAATRQASLARQLARESTRTLEDVARHARVQVARDELRQIRDLSRTIEQLVNDLKDLVEQVAPQLLAQNGIGPLIAAAIIGEVAGIDRFTTDAQLARIAGCAPVPVASGRTDLQRLDRGGNRQLNHAIHMLALTRIRTDPRTAAYIAKYRRNGKTLRHAIRALKRHLIRWIYRLLTNPNTIPQTICLT